MPGSPSRMQQNFREQLMSDDINRIGKLAGRERLNAAAYRSVRADFYDPASNTFDDLAAAAKIANSSTIPGLTYAPSLEGIAATFDMNIGIGEANIAGTPGSTDESPYLVARWAAQTIAWPVGGNPDAANPKICLICATPADVYSDLATRNILVDEVTRTTSPQLVYKTSTPIATLSVEVGAAAASPVPPAVPAGAIALFEVWVPALAADSTVFQIIRRAWRRIEFPGTSQHGIVKGCELAWNAAMGAENGIISNINRVVIDGELLTFTIGTPISGLIQVADTAHTPAAAPAGNDAPSYIYLCGGRGQPLRSYTAGLEFLPVVLVESTVVPDELGYPTADMTIAVPPVTIPRAAALFIGIRMRQAGGLVSVETVTRSDDWIYSEQGIGVGGATSEFHGFLEALQAAHAVFTPVTLGSLPDPAACDRVDLMMILQDPAGAGLTSWISNTGAVAGSLAYLITTGSASNAVYDRQHVIVNRATCGALDHLGNNVTTLIAPMGFHLRIPRLGK